MRNLTPFAAIILALGLSAIMPMATAEQNNEAKPATEQPVQMTDSQMDKVTAGEVRFLGPPVHAPDPILINPPIRIRPRPPIIIGPIEPIEPWPIPY